MPLLVDAEVKPFESSERHQHIAPSSTTWTTEIRVDVVVAVCRGRVAFEGPYYTMVGGLKTLGDEEYICCCPQQQVLPIEK